MAKDNLSSLKQAGKRQGKVKQETSYIQKAVKKNTWKAEGKEYKRVNIDLDRDVLKRLKNEIIDSDVIKCESQLINKVLEHYFKSHTTKEIEKLF